MKKAAPGTFFALFGAAVIGVSLWKGLHFDGARPPAQQNPKIVSNGSPGGHGLGDMTSRPTSDQLEATRADTRATIFELNTLQARLPADFPKNQLTGLRDAIRNSKLALLYSVWSKEWGDYEQFKEWINNLEQQPMPAGFKSEGVEFFHYGEKK